MIVKFPRFVLGIFAYERQRTVARRAASHESKYLYFRVSVTREGIEMLAAMAQS
jgi:hypothetical protein